MKIENVQEKVKQFFAYYKWLPLYLYYRVTHRGWTPSEDMFSNSCQGFSYLYRRFVFHHELMRQTLPLLNNKQLSDHCPEKLFTPKELNDAGPNNYANPDVFKKDEE